GERWGASNLRTLDIDIDRLPAEMADLAWGDALPNLPSLRITTTALDCALVNWVSTFRGLKHLTIELKSDSWGADSNDRGEERIEAMLASLENLRSLRLRYYPLGGGLRIRHARLKNIAITN